MCSALCAPRARPWPFPWWESWCWANRRLTSVYSSGLGRLRPMLLPIPTCRLLPVEFVVAWGSQVPIAGIVAVVPELWSGDLGLFIIFIWSLPSVSDYLYFGPQGEGCKS